MDEFDELQQLEILKEDIQEQMKGMQTAEADFTEANEAMIKFIQDNEAEDELVSGTGSGWKDLATVVAEKEEPGATVQEDRCCVIF